MAADKEFNGLSEKFFYTIMERNPILATYMGLHQYDDKLPSGTRRSKLEDIQIAKEYLSAFEDFDTSQLSPHNVLDRDLAVYGLKLAVFEEEALRIWESLPFAADTIGSSLFPLFTREYASFEKRVESIVQRLENAPRYVEESRELLSDPVKLWVKIGYESAQRLPDFLKTILSTARARSLDVVSRLERAILEMEESLKDYCSWLSSELLSKARERYAVGGEVFERLIELRGLGMTVNEILAFGERALEDEKRKLKGLAEKIRSDASVEQVREEIRSKHPESFEEVLDMVRGATWRTRSFVLDSGFASIPEDEELLVTETPSFLRHVVPFAAYFSPAKFEERKIGVYVVTPPDGNLAMLKEHCYASIPNTAAHEGYPGHHLQITCSVKHPSLIRALFSGVEFVEGWAHYCEEAMKEMGFEDTLEARFIQSDDMVWRAVRIILDVKISKGEMSFDEAVNFLVKETGMERAGAEAEVRRYTYTPGYQLSYYLGKHMIKQLKMETKKRMGERFSDRVFHDALLYSGGLPIKFMRRIVEAF